MVWRLITFAYFSINVNVDKKIVNIIWKRHFFHGNVWIPLRIRLFHKGQMNNDLALVRVTAWNWTGDKPLPVSMLTNFVEQFLMNYEEISFNWLSGNEPLVWSLLQRSLLQKFGVYLSFLFNHFLPSINERWKVYILCVNRIIFSDAKLRNMTQLHST